MTEAVDRDRLILLLGALQEGQKESKERRDEMHGMIREMSGKVDKLASESASEKVAAKAYGRRVDDLLGGVNRRLDRIEGRVVTLEQRSSQKSPAEAADAPSSEQTQKGSHIPMIATGASGVAAGSIIFSDRALDFLAKLFKAIFGIH